MIDKIEEQIKLVSILRRKPKHYSDFVENLQRLQRMGKTESEINQVIQQADLPFGFHLFITAHFSDLMELRF